jgi:riboflavin synthase
MFTGIITGIGTVLEATSAEGGVRLTIQSPFQGLEPGESVAVDGACLTVETVTTEAFRVHVIRTTLDRTQFGEFTAGRRVNLERAIQVGDRLGGHLVQAHVDGVGIVERITDDDDARLLNLRVPPAIGRVSPPLGSITVDGVSLTVNAKPDPDVIQISLIPFTLQHTTLGERRVGDRVHLEGDAIGKYVRALLEEQKRER